MDSPTNPCWATVYRVTESEWVTNMFAFHLCLDIKQTQARIYKHFTLCNFSILLEYENLEELILFFYVSLMQSNKEVAITPKACTKLDWISQNYLAVWSMADSDL